MVHSYVKFCYGTMSIRAWCHVQPGYQCYRSRSARGPKRCSTTGWRTGWEWGHAVIGWARAAGWYLHAAGAMLLLLAGAYVVYYWLTLGGLLSEVLG